MAHTLYELDVRLREIEPPIWRTIEVPGTASLEEVHFAIQIAMGWTNSHLHQFVIGNARFGMTHGEGAEDSELEDERRVTLEEIAKKGSQFGYEYDFGDSWEHDVTVTKVTTQTKVPKPRWTAGARACPPEDCGGVGGYENLLAALRDPNHEEHGTLVEWSGNFKPEKLALPKAGLDLQKSMSELEALAHEDGELDDEDDLMPLPRQLVDDVLALEPMQRASLAAVIAGSLASELVETIGVAEQLAERLQKQHTKPHAPTPKGRKRARS